MPSGIVLHWKRLLARIMPPWHILRIWESGMLSVRDREVHNLIRRHLLQLLPCRLDVPQSRSVTNHLSSRLLCTSKLRHLPHMCGWILLQQQRSICVHSVPCWLVLSLEDYCHCVSSWVHKCCRSNVLHCLSCGTNRLRSHQLCPLSCWISMPGTRLGAHRLPTRHPSHHGCVTGCMFCLPCQ